MFDIGTPELILILIIVIVLFGSKKLPELSKGIGDSMREIRKAISEDDSDHKTTKKTKSSA